MRFITSLFRSFLTLIAGLMICVGVLASTTIAASPKKKPSSKRPPAEALKYAINGYEWALAHNDVANPNILTVVDFNEPSYDKRLWIINLKTDRVIMNTYVAQGRATGAVYATHFSNQPGSHASSPGIFTTEDTYDGEHGRSLRIDGLEAGINSNALSRAIVIHPAAYMTRQFITSNGYAGRSWGCFALPPALAEKIISLVENGSVWFAYASVEKHDDRVDHSLSDQGQAIYDKIMGGGSENIFERIF